MGGIAKLDHADGRTMTLNVEYNQLDPLLKAQTGVEFLGGRSRKLLILRRASLPLAPTKC